MAITIGELIKNNAFDDNFKPYPNIDSAYGTYASVKEANEKINKDSRSIGLTVGVLVGNEITEYWYNGGIENSHLVAKNVSNGGGEGSGINLIVGEDIEDTTIFLNEKYPNAKVPTMVIDRVNGGLYIKYDTELWVKSSGTILSNALPTTAKVTGANILAHK